MRSNISSAEQAYFTAMLSIPSASTVLTSCSVMPQMAENCGSIVMFFRLLMVEKMLNCENFVMPVMKQNLIIASLSFRGW